MSIQIARRQFLGAAAGAVALAAAPWSRFAWGEDAADAPLYKISLGEYSLHRALAKGELDHLDFAKVSKTDYDIDGVEYWNRPFMDKAKDAKYIAELKKRADDHGVKSLIILVDGEGNLGAPNAVERMKAVENHYKWVEAAKELGCHSIRVNAGSEGSYDEQLKLAADGLRRLSEFGAKHDMNVIVENHGGLSSNGKWLAGVMQEVNLPNCGTLPDFGNFHDYDRYVGVDETMPFAKAVSAKSHDFDDEGNETRTDYLRMMKIVAIDHGYRGYVGIEYEGGKLPEPDGIRATKKLLERVRDQLEAAPAEEQAAS